MTRSIDSDSTHTTDRTVNVPQRRTGKSPRRPPLAFRVGVVGHRPNRLKNADLDRLTAAIGSILRTVKDEVVAMYDRDGVLFDGSHPNLRAISPLAEGTDRIFAEQALKLGFELCCVMPFTQSEFEKDFAPNVASEDNSLARFQDLVGQANTKFEMDGIRSDEGSSYGAAGKIVLNQSDLLVVVWDGERQNLRGGTEETMDEARRQGVPIVLVDAHAPHGWQILDSATVIAHTSETRYSPGDGEATSPLAKFVRQALELPQPAPDKPGSSHVSSLAVTENAARGLDMFYKEKRPHLSFAVVWSWFRDIFGDGKVPEISFAVTPFENTLGEEWQESKASSGNQLLSQLKSYYAWPDGLAIIYAKRYRSAFVLAFLLAALAVGMALLPFGLGIEGEHPPNKLETFFIVLELCSILVILGLVIVSVRSRWHERWINYRFTAELIRHLRFVSPMGGRRPFPQIPAHWAVYGHPNSTWMVWYVRAVERALGLRSVAVNKEYVNACLDQLDQLVRGQESFHEVAVNRCERIEKRLHQVGIALLVLTLTSCVLHLLHAPYLAPHVLTFFCGFFPALGAAFAAILNQGEFRRIKMRSESMCGQLNVVQKEIKDLRERIRDSLDPPQEQFSVPAGALANDVVRLLLNEVLDWRVVFLDRPFERPPG